MNERYENVRKYAIRIKIEIAQRCAEISTENNSVYHLSGLPYWYSWRATKNHLLLLKPLQTRVRVNADARSLNARCQEYLA